MVKERVISIRCSQQEVSDSLLQCPQMKAPIYTAPVFTFFTLCSLSVDLSLSFCLSLSVALPLCHSLSPSATRRGVLVLTVCKGVCAVV